MLIFNKQKALSAHLMSVRNSLTTVGFVPTMGALHQGHLSLLKASLAQNSVTVISIFVNPTQFNNSQDLEDYPRTLDQDILKIKSLSDEIIVFSPDVNDLYQGNTIASEFNFDGLEHQLEGKFRPGHFDGVGTIVKRLFEIIQPTNAYFGEKDFQQLAIVKKLVAKENMSVNVIGCPILRESNGLAMSSRNERLSTEDREQASIIFKILTDAKQLFGTENASVVTAFVNNAFSELPNFKLEYFEITDQETLQPIVERDSTKKYRAFIAVFVNDVRLIDTIALN